MKKIIPHVKRVVLLLICLAAVIPAMSMKQAEAASLSSKNRKAHILYDKKVKAAKRISTSVQYKYADITGDGVHEAIIDYHPKNGGSGHYFCIYTYKNGKAKQLLKYGQYGLTKLSVYKKTKTIVCYGAGHGGEWYSFLKLKNGKYKEIAGKSRRGIAGGWDKNMPWGYWKGNYQSITKKEYTSITQKMKKGKVKKYDLTKWGYWFAS